MRVGFVGLGQMGQVMAGRLLEAGHDLVVYNRSPAAGRALAERGASVASEPQAALDAEVVITMLADDTAIEAVWIRGGLVGKMGASTVHANMATVSLGMGERLARLHEEAGNGYVSAPVFGRPSAAAAGQLDIVAAGADAALDRCRPLFAVLGKQTFTVGAEPQLANIVKIARNFLLATVVESLGEAFALVRKSGVDPATFLGIITSTSFNAPAYKSYGQRMVDKDFEPTFALKLGLKDVELALDAGAGSGVPMPTAELIRERHLAAISAGFGDLDWVALGEFIAQDAGLH